MLTKLYVENYALIDRLDIDFDNALNIITGETGAGKSILLGALGMLMGNRSDAGVVKDRERNCVVEGTFAIGDYDLEWFFSEHDLDYDPHTIIRRVVSPAGKSRAYINDLPVQQTELKEFSTYLIDIHSQHQSLQIGEERFRIGTLDSIAAHKELLEKYSVVYHSMRAAEKDLERLREEAARSSRDEEWLRYQVDELEAAKLSEGEMTELEQRHGELSHAEDIKTAVALGAQRLGEDETGVIPVLKSIEHSVHGIADVYPKAGEICGRLHSVLVELRDLESELGSESERIDSDPMELQKVSERIDLIFTLQKKHKAADIAELIAMRDEYSSRLSVITGSDEAVAELESKIARLDNEARGIAAEITGGRKRAGEKLEKHIEQTLAQLGMPDTKFAVEIAPTEKLNINGADSVRFMFSANKNIAPAPVEKVASGGEISRLMLALKSLVAQSSKLPTIIFDEIDTGVSGRIADAMGGIIETLSQNMQVVNITHLPQVASKGQTHFFVYKDSSGDAAQTRIRLLAADERVDEIAKMLSGSTITSAAIEQAKLLLRE